MKTGKFRRLCGDCAKIETMLKPRQIRYPYQASRFSLRKVSRRRWLILLSTLSSLLFVIIVGGSLFGFLLFTVYSKDLPSPNRLVERDIPLSTKILDRHGELLYDVYGEQNRTLVKLEELPPALINATLATEDADFYLHRGFDLVGITRSLFYIVARRNLQGGSTITQQLVKNALLSSERTVTRKIKELVLSLQIERRYSKDEILQMYLNEVSYGGQSNGVEAAAQMYFGKSAKDLTLAEAALLAGLPQKPSVYSPFGSYPENARARQSYVLHLMSDRGWVGKDGQRHFLGKKEAEDAKKAEIKYATPGGRIKAPHFVMYIKRLLEERYGEKMVEEGGLKVTTSLDLKMQEEAEKIVAEEVEKAKSLKVGNGALVALDPRTGEILAMVGSRDYFDVENQGNFNVAVDGLRQPGSAIKPITYATAFKKGYTAATMIMDVPTTFPGGRDNPDYKPENYDGNFRGPLQLRYALGNSINLVAVKLLKMVGVPAALQTAHEMGITTLNEPDRYGLSLTLGGGEIKLVDLVSAYGVFANSGKHHDVVSLLEVRDSKERLLEKSDEESGTTVLTPEQAYLVSDILADNNARSLAFGTYSPLVIPNHTVAVKTGTTDDKKDNWTIGYTPSLVVGVWVGNNNNTAMDPHLASGITGAAPIWHRAVASFLKDKPNEPFVRPEGIVEMDIDALTGYLPFETARVRREIFIRGTVPTAHSDMYQRLKICKSDGKIAAKPCEEAGNFEEKIYVRLTDALPEWQEFTEKWLSENKDKLEPEHSEWYPPSEQSFLYFDENGRINREEKPLVKILDIRDGDTVSASFPVKANIISPYTVLKVEVYLDGQLLDPPLTSIPYEKKVTLSEDNTGRHRILVRGYDSGGNVGEKEITVKYQTALGGL